MSRLLATIAALLLAATAPLALAQTPDGYAVSGSTPAPTDIPVFKSEQIALLMQTLGAVEAEGFQRDEFTPPELDGLLRSPNAQDRQRGAVMLKAAICAYAKAQHGARLPAGAFLKNWGMHPAFYAAESEFDVAFTQDRLSQWLDELAPPFDRYVGLRTALAQYRSIVDKGGWPTIQDGPKLQLEARGVRVQALRRRLAAEDPQSTLDATAAIYDQSVMEAVQHFQHNVGLEPSGVVDTATLAALNVPVERRILQLQANMERWRWMPRLWPSTRIEANIPASEMDAFQDNAIVLEMRAAPGRPDDQTPILSSEVQSVVFDPPWNVPSSISTKELLPKERAHPGYLARHGYRLISTGDDGGHRIQQKFGPKSALGKMKFDFPNNYSVYLHDTPSRAAFSKTSRAVSHGCVRLQRPKELADLLFQNDPKWTPEHIDDTIAQGDTVRASLPKPMPIFLMYWTAFLDVKGRVNFRDDVYDWDAALMRLIAASHDRV